VVKISVPGQNLYQLHLIYFRDAPDTVFAGYPACRISGSSKSRIPDIRPDTWLDNYIFDKISSKVMKTALQIIDFCKH
jgi:hypothetical protein